MTYQQMTKRKGVLGSNKIIPIQNLDGDRISN